MEALMDEMTASPSEEAHAFRDVSLLRSIPGIGRIVTGALLAEAAGPLAQRDYYAFVRTAVSLRSRARAARRGKSECATAATRDSATLSTIGRAPACSTTVAANSNTPASAPPATAMGARFAVLPIGF
jgi:hypothetical protein